MCRNRDKTNLQETEWEIFFSYYLTQRPRALPELILVCVAQSNWVLLWYWMQVHHCWTECKVHWRQPPAVCDQYPFWVGGERQGRAVSHLRIQCSDRPISQTYIPAGVCQHNHNTATLTTKIGRQKEKKKRTDTGWIYLSVAIAIVFMISSYCSKTCIFPLCSTARNNNISIWLACAKN